MTTMAKKPKTFSELHKQLTINIEDVNYAIREFGENLTKTGPLSEDDVTAARHIRSTLLVLISSAADSAVAINALIRSLERAQALGAETAGANKPGK